MPLWDADDYKRHSGAQQSWARELIEKLALRGDECVLDVGSGDGKVTAEIAAQVPRGHVVGVDSSPEMVRFAHETFPAERCPRLRFEIGDAADLHFEEEFDVVFSNATLHWIVDHAPVLAGIARALVPGGRMLVQMAGRGNAAAVVATVHDLIARREWREHFDRFAFPYGFHGVDEYRLWITQAGLTAERVELLDRDMKQTGAEGLAGWIRTTWLPYIERVPEERRADFVAAIVARYVEAHPCDAEGLVHVAMTRLEVEARRPD